MYKLSASDELSAMSGGLILIVLLLIITAIVFAIKFGLDIALNNKLSDRTPEFKQYPQKQENRLVYAIKNEPVKRRTPPKTAKSNYTIIPEDKLYILENPANKDRYR